MLDSFDKSDNLNQENIPSHPNVFLNFIDILFAALIAYQISEIPVTGYGSLSNQNIIVFLLMYVLLIMKMFLHWWALHFEIPIGEIYMAKKAGLPHYAGALVTSCFFVINSKLLTEWYDGRFISVNLIKAVFAILAFFRLLDIIVNVQEVTKYAKTARQFSDVKEITRESNILIWHQLKRPRLFLFYLVHILISLGVLVLNESFLLILVLFYVLAEIIIETLLFQGRRKYLYQTLN